MYQLYGMDVITSPYLPKVKKQVQKKTHKWKWLNWIYLKLFGYETIEEEQFFVIDKKLLMSPYLTNVFKPEPLFMDRPIS